MTNSFRTNLPYFFAALFLSAFFLSIMMAIWKSNTISVGWLTRDVNAIAKLPYYYGFLSQLGLLFWAATGIMCIMASRVFPKDNQDKSQKIFLYASGMFTLILCMDDAFQFHERVFPSFGIPERLVLFSYAGIAATYVGLFYKEVLKTNFVLLIFAILFLATSVGLDVLNPSGINLFLWEDSAKFVGIIFWFMYFFQTCVMTIRNLVSP